MKKIYLLFFAGYFLVLTTQSQTFGWRTGFHGFFDNREYFNEYINDQTMFGARVFAEAGFALDDYNRFGAGLNYLYEFGSKGDLIAPDITIYYNANRGAFNFCLGAFPRKELLNLPLILLTDTLDYYRPNVEGMFAELKRDWGFQNIWIDWTGRQTSTRRETFLIGGTGRIGGNILFYEHNFIMYHYAAPAIPIPDDHLRDNGGLTAVMGLNLSSVIPFDSVALSSGVALSYDRLRNVYDTRTAAGWYTEIDLLYHGFGIHGLCHLGNAHTLLYGDRFYTSKSYQRIDLSYARGSSSGITGSIQFSLHFVPGSVDFSQMVSVYINLEPMARKLPSD